MHPETPAFPAQRFNALKHGAYAQFAVLPGEDPLAFRRERRALFHNYRPQTKHEADLVHAMAEHGWAARRYGYAQTAFDGQAMSLERDAAGRICEPIAHQRLHSGMDVTVQRQRIEKLWHRACVRLVLMQKLRRLGLIEGAVALPKGCYMETDGRVFGPVAQPVIVPLPEPEIEADGAELSTSSNVGNGKYSEQKEMGEAAQSRPAVQVAPAAPTDGNVGGNAERRGLDDERIRSEGAAPERRFGEGDPGCQPRSIQINLAHRC